MRSIDSLREWANGLHGIYINQVDHTITVTTGWDVPPDMDSVSLRDHINGILDGIEREVADMVPLPVDADGEPIHVGDVVVEDGCGVPYKVMSLKLFEDCWDVGECGMNPNLCHHHAPTVEDVLRKFIESWSDTEGREDERRVMDEYAAKLQLKEE